MAAQCSGFSAKLAREALADLQKALVAHARAQEAEAGAACSNDANVRAMDLCAVDYVDSMHGVRQALSIVREALGAHADETEAKASRAGMSSCMQLSV